VSPLNAAETALAGEYNLRPGPVARAWEYWSVRLEPFWIEITHILRD
jgi:hypothetical protein